MQNVEKLHTQTSWDDRGHQNIDLFSRNCMSEMRPRSDADRQIGSTVGNQATALKYSEKKLYFVPV